MEQITLIFSKRIAEICFAWSHSVLSTDYKMNHQTTSIFCFCEQMEKYAVFLLL